MTFHNISGDAAIMLHFLIASLDHIYFLKAFRHVTDEYHYHFSITVEKSKGDTYYTFLYFVYKTDVHTITCSKFANTKIEAVNTFAGIKELKEKMIHVINKEVQNDPQKRFYDKDI